MVPKKKKIDFNKLERNRSPVWYVFVFQFLVMNVRSISIIYLMGTCFFISCKMECFNLFCSMK